MEYKVRVSVAAMVTVTLSGDPKKFEDNDGNINRDAFEKSLFERAEQITEDMLDKSDLQWTL